MRKILIIYFLSSLVNLNAQVLIPTDSLLILTNTLRKSKNLLSFNTDSSLTQMAILHARQMATLNFFSHQNPKNPKYRDMKLRAASVGFKYHYIAENIAYLQSASMLSSADLAERFYHIWYDSKPHFRNMTSTQAQSIGIAIVQIQRKGLFHYYAVQNFGTRL